VVGPTPPKQHHLFGLLFPISFWGYFANIIIIESISLFVFNQIINCKFAVQCNQLPLTDPFPYIRTNFPSFSRGPCGPALFHFRRPSSLCKLADSFYSGRSRGKICSTYSAKCICICSACVHSFLRFFTFYFPLGSDVNGKSLEPNRNHVELICLESRVQAIENWKKRLTG